MTRRVPRAVWSVTALGYAFLHLPLLVLALFSLNASRYGTAFTGPSLAWYRRLLERPDIARALRASLLVGTVSTAVATVLGTMLALALARLPARRQRTGEVALYLPIVTPEVIAGIALLVLFTALGVELGLVTVTLAHTAFSLPFVTVVVLARLRGLDPALPEAALLLGADELTAFRRVTLPLLAPAVGAGALLAFTLSFDDFVITFFVAGAGATTLPLLVYSMARRGIEPTINAVSTVILVATTLLIWGSERLQRRAGAPPRDA